MDEIQFEAWPKTPRLFRDVTITEKIDGTNGAIIIIPIEDPSGYSGDARLTFVFDQGWFLIQAQSRSRLITPDADNHGLASWVDAFGPYLVADLGPGRHFGEWWGQGIRRGYGLNHKRFSLFNTAKWDPVSDGFVTPALGVVPVLYQGSFAEWQILDALEWLKDSGSAAAPGFMSPEGVCIYHTSSRQVFKYTLDGDGAKGA